MEAENALLGAAMLSPVAAEVVCNQTQPEDFYHPRNQTIRDAVEHVLFSDGRTPDTTLVWHRIQEMGQEDQLGGSSIVLLDMISMVPAIGNAEAYCKIVVEQAALRKMIGAAAIVQEIGYSLPDDVGVAIDEARTAFDNIAAPLNTNRLLPTIEDIIHRPITYDWVVEGLLEKGDRLILTGPEGKGKSTFLRQLGMCCAAGIHPFRDTRMKPVDVVYVDCENPPGLITRRFRSLHAAASKTLTENRFHLAERPEGLDLLHARDSMWLQEVMATYRPQLLIIGPVYKLHADDPNDEKPARAVQRVLDVCRTRFGGCAIVIEAHSPHGPTGARELRPFGASAWLRWPEFGFGIRPEKNTDEVAYFQEWRGSRDEREWPLAIRRGGTWPWHQISRDEARDAEALAKADARGARAAERTVTAADPTDPHKDEMF